MNKSGNIIYTTQKASEKDVYLHLLYCNEQFTPVLSDRLNIKDYAQKIQNNAVQFEAWDNDELVGLVAAYFNDEINYIGYITSVSVYKEYNGLGIGSRLMQECCHYAKDKRFKAILLEVHKDNRPAILVYKKYGFEQTEDLGNNIIKMTKQL